MMSTHRRRTGGGVEGWRTRDEIVSVSNVSRSRSFACVSLGYVRERGMKTNRNDVETGDGDGRKYGVNESTTR